MIYRDYVGPAVKSNAYIPVGTDRWWIRCLCIARQKESLVIHRSITLDDRVEYQSSTGDKTPPSVSREDYFDIM